MELESDQVPMEVVASGSMPEEGEEVIPLMTPEEMVPATVEQRLAILEA